jgi:hypothetical protein
MSSPHRVGEGKTVSYNHAENLTLDSSNNFVTTSASHNVNGKSTKCGAKKLGSNPSGPF